MAAVASIPGLSQLMDWPTAHLTDAAAHWEAVAERSYGLANQVWRDASSVDWQGNAADALRVAAHSDMLATSAAADQLQTAAQVARRGASDLYAAHSRLLYAIEDAQIAGFDVDEEGSVIDRSTGGSAARRAARQVEADALAADIRQRATQLVAVDQQVAGNVTTAVAGIRGAFPQNPKFTAVDNHTFKQDPAPRDPNGDQPWKYRPPPKTLEEAREAMRQLRRGRNAPHREVDTPEEIRDFWDWLTKGAKDLPPRGDTARKVLDDGTEIDLRPDSSSGGITIEVMTPGSGKNPKVHLPIPPADDPPKPAPGGDRPQSPTAPAPGRPVPGSQGSAQPQAPATDANPSSPGGQSWLGEIAHDLSEGGKAVFGWVVVGGVLVWTIVSGVGQSGDTASP